MMQNCEIRIGFQTHRNSRTRMRGPSSDIVILWGSKMVACEGKNLKLDYNTTVDYFEVCQSLWHF